MPTKSKPTDELQFAAWQCVLTVAEGKRLIAKGVAAMEKVQRALEDGIVVVTKGTTNAYVAEELLGGPIPKRKYVLGRTTPVTWTGDDEGFFAGSFPEVILRNGKRLEGVTLAQIIGEMVAGDVIIKGANALDYRSHVAGVLIGHPTGGTVGTILGHIYGKGLNLIIPVGLEKQVVDPIAGPEWLTLGARLADAALGGVPRLWPIHGEIVTEIEALHELTLHGLTIQQIGAGGVCGAEGACRLMVQGEADEVDEARRVVESVQGEPAFGELGE
jgi:hypothetical protein